MPSTDTNSLFSKDSDIRKFDTERLLCAIWISINHEDHLQAVQTWFNHHGECVKRAAAVLDQDQTVAVAVALANMSFVLAGHIFVWYTCRHLQTKSKLLSQAPKIKLSLLLHFQTKSIIWTVLFPPPKLALNPSPPCILPLHKYPLPPPHAMYLSKESPDQGRGDEDDDMDAGFDYRGVSGSGSPASTGRSRSVASIASADDGQGSELYDYGGGRIRTS
ncbi:hypothetical protein F5050DRAFT_1714845 [Lentinula boryana]|uniref:Uncharacterized protein n=1 Tax=Lentinula boryana TaxID=40481 RepID=A0ABQ8Q512_9AGAR|nr:hypothetical protein F5050DRAFT_1714845 [Lentinula boryana]